MRTVSNREVIVISDDDDTNTTSSIVISRKLNFSETAISIEPSSSKSIDIESQSDSDQSLPDLTIDSLKQIKAFKELKMKESSLSSNPTEIRYLLLTSSKSPML